MPHCWRSFDSFQMWPMWPASLRALRLASLAVAVCLWSQPGAINTAKAQILDAGRGFEDGCEQPSPPPHSPTARSDKGPVVMARYFGATDVYPHGALGDPLEAEGLMVRYDDGERVVCDTVLAGPDRVFEDSGPRLADVDGDGMNEVIAVASHDRFGARLEIYGYPGLGQDFQLIAETPYIGTGFRWLAPVATADLDNDGLVELAYIDRPHLAKTLRVWRYTQDGLQYVDDMPGLSNHKFGWEFIAGGLRDCDGNKELVLASADWRQVVAVSLKQGRLSARPVGSYAGPESLDTALSCENG